MAVPPVGELTYSPKFAHQAMVREQISLHGDDRTGIKIFSPPKGGKSAHVIDPDEGTVGITIYQLVAEDMHRVADLEDPRGTKVSTITSVDVMREGTGVYSYQLTPPLTSTRGNLTVVWNYAVDGIIFEFTSRLSIMDEMPTYNALSDMEKYQVAQTTWALGDLFDSTEGGPNLTENFQTHFTNERLAQLLSRAITKFNMTGQPVTDWDVSFMGGGVRGDFAGIISICLYVETLRHLVRTYVEIPEFTSMDVTYTQRRDYLQRWQGVLRDEEKDLEHMIKMAKRKLMSLGRGSLLVGGGIFGGTGKTSLFRPGMQTSIERSWKMYPAAFAVSGFAHMSGGKH